MHATIEDAAIALACERHLAEIEMCASLLCNPMLAVPVARQHGVTAALFDCLDTRLIFCGCDVAAQYRCGPIQTLRVIAKALREAGHWSNQAAIAPPFGSRWCVENLTLLARLEYFSCPIVRRNAKELIELHSRMRRAQGAINIARRLLGQRGAA